MKRANIYKLFKDASRNKIITLSLDTTLEYIIDDGGTVVLPSATNIYLIVNFPSILMSNSMFTFTCS